MGFLVTMSFLCVVWMSGNLILHMLLNCIGLRDKMSLDIKLSRNKKYLTKVNPIYKLIDEEGGMRVYRWDLGYGEVYVGLTYFFIPYPIRILKYGYIENDLSFYICHRDDLEENINIEKFYEKEYKNVMDVRLASKRRDELVNSFNKVFNENYE